MKKHSRIFVIAVVLYVLTFTVAIYVGVWLMCIKPIIGCCVAFDGGTLTAVMVGKTILSYLFASIVSGIIIVTGSSIIKILAEKFSKKKRRKTR